MQKYDLQVAAVIDEGLAAAGAAKTAMRREGREVSLLRQKVRVA